MADRQITEVNLIDDMANLVAQASYSDDEDDTLTRNFQLFFKGQNTVADPANYSIQLITKGGTPTQISNNDLQWGVRVY